MNIFRFTIVHVAHFELDTEAISWVAINKLKDNKKLPFFVFSERYCPI